MYVCTRFKDRILNQSKELPFVNHFVYKNTTSKGLAIQKKYSFRLSKWNEISAPKCLLWNLGKNFVTLCQSQIGQLHDGESPALSEELQLLLIALPIRMQCASESMRIVAETSGNPM